MSSRQINQILIFSIVLFSLTLSANPKQAGAVIFSDDFNERGLFVANWTTTGKPEFQNGQVLLPTGASLILNKSLPSTFQFSVKITMDKQKENQKGVAFCFIRFGKFLAYFRNDGLAYVTGGEKEVYKGKLFRNIKPGVPVEWNTTCVRDGEYSKFTTFLNGEFHSVFTIKDQKDGEKLNITPGNTSVFLDDFVLSSVALKNTSPNLIINSSFEHLLDGMPDYYNVDTGRVYSYKQPYEEFLKTCVIDTQEKHSGKNSLKMVFDDSVTWQQGIFTVNTGVIIGSPATFSVYLKADRDNFPVILSIWEYVPKWSSQTVYVSKEWKRYDFTIPSPKFANFRCGVVFRQPGTLWVDDLQLELAEKASPYKVSDNDVMFNKTEKVSLNLDSFTIKRASKTPAMDGNLDSWIADAVKFTPLTVKKKKTENATEIYAVCDENNLYLGVRAHVKELSKIRKKITDWDDFGIFAQENVEIMIDPGKTGKEYFHFVASAAGSQTDFGKGRDKTWNGAWKNVVRINQEKSSIDYELQFPLTIFSGQDILGKWGIHIGRNDTETGEISSLLNSSKIDFHQVTQYPAMELPFAILKLYALGIDKATVPAQDVLALKINNNTDSALDVSCTITVENRVVGETDFSLKKGSVLYSFPLTPPLQKDAWIVCRLKDKKGKLLLDQRIFAELVSSMTAVSRYSRYTLADKEAVFRITTSLPNPSKLTAEIRCGNVVTRVPCAESFDAVLPLEKVPEGSHPAIIRLLSETKTVGITSVPLIKMSLPEGAARINNFVKCLELNGENTFFFMPLLCTHPSPAQDGKKMADWLHEQGFKQCIFFFSIGHGIKKTVDFLTQAKKYGIAVVAWNEEWYRNDDDALVAKEIQQLSAIGSIAAWQVLDEPDLNYKSDVAKNYMLRMMKRIPAYPVYMNNTVIGIPNRYADYATDILILDNYLTGDTSESGSVRNMVLRPLELLLRASKVSRNQPCWLWLEGNNTHNTYREATYGEQIAQTWGSIVGGATGLPYFYGMPKWPGNWKAFKQLNKEILALNDVILSEEHSANAFLSNKELRWTTRKFQGYLYVIVVNIDYTPHNNVTISLPNDYRYANDAEIEFENRKIILKDGRFTDSFSALSRHIYKIKLQ